MTKIGFKAIVRGLGRTHTKISKVQQNVRKEKKWLDSQFVS